MKSWWFEYWSNIEAIQRSRMINHSARLWFIGRAQHILISFSDHIYMYMHCRLLLYSYNNIYDANLLHTNLEALVWRITLTGASKCVYDYAWSDDRKLLVSVDESAALRQSIIYRWTLSAIESAAGHMN